MFVDRRTVQMKNPSEVTPVIGVNIHIPTSGDVHLFPDPATYRSKRPIYYADCEGLLGGNREPMESAIRSQSAEDVLARTMLHAERTQQAKILWANGNVTREKLVATLYPRVLFTFSDIVVFVSKELRYD